MARPSKAKTPSAKPKTAKKKAAAKKTVAKIATRGKAPKDESELLAELAIKGIQEKKGKDIVCLDLRNLNTAMSDFFVVCNADSGIQVAAIADSVEETVRRSSGEKPWHSEGFENAEWVLLDYSSVVVHIFNTEKREFYALEKLWADAEVQKIAGNY